MQKYKNHLVGGIQLTGLVFLWITFSGLRHPFYLGVEEVKYNQKTQSLEISIRLFTDDFEKCLSSHFNKPVNLFIHDASPQLDSMVAKYLARHFQILHQSAPLPMHFIGYEKSEEATWSYFESPLPVLPQSLIIHNRLLYDCIREQSNIMHFKTDQRTSSYKLNFPDSSYQWNLH